MNKHILLVDDEVSIRELMSVALIKQGHSVTVVGSGKEALNYLRSHSVDVIISDVRMPNGDGPSILRGIDQILEQKPYETKPKIIFISGFDDLGRIETYNSNKIDYILSKPFTMDKIIGLI